MKWPLLLVLLLPAGALAAPVAPAYQWKFTHHLARPSDAIVVTDETAQNVFAITNSIGIGSAAISATTAHWPQRVVFHFLYEKGRGFHSLESFSLNAGRILLTGSARTSGKMPFYLADAAGSFNTNEAAAGEMNVVVQESNGAMEVSLPPNLLVGCHELQVAWIDYYR